MLIIQESEGNDEEAYFFRIAEAIFVAWFTLEYLVRFLVAPRKVRNWEKNIYWLSVGSPISPDVRPRRAKILSQF